MFVTGTFDARTNTVTVIPMNWAVNFGGGGDGGDGSTVDQDSKLPIATKAASIICCQPCVHV